MRVTIFGATGLLGKALLGQWSGDDLTALGSAQADIRNSELVENVVAQAKPEWIVLAAAYTDVDGCEINPNLALSVNTYGAVNIAKAAVRAGSKLLFISTDYVFDGKKNSPYENDEPRNPINAYGKSKAEAEGKLSEIHPKVCIVRTSWLFGPGGKCFPDTILKIASSRKQIEVVNDQRGCPTYTLDLAAAIIKLCRSGAEGIVHCTNAGDCTWYEFAQEIVRQSELRTTVRPTSSDKYVRPAVRPSYSVLSPRSLSAYGVKMRPWQETLGQYLAERMSSNDELASRSAIVGDENAQKR
jgi:dTDP-4-dehydrorhamnose reductase